MTTMTTTTDATDTQLAAEDAVLRDEMGDFLSAEDLGITSEQYADAVAESLGHGDQATGFVRCAGVRVYATR